MKHWLSVLLTAWLSIAQADPFGDELLPAEQAFDFSAEMVAPDRVRASWRIADGYYMYRSKFQFATAADGVQLGTAEIPRGKVKQDEFFGEIETDRKSVV